MKKSKKGTWLQAILTFISPVLFLFFLRWVIFEPFVIPSGSMIPTLLIHDHIFVLKSSFGLRKFWDQGFLLRWSAPQVGDIVVFKYPENPEIFYVKRVVAGPGDLIEVKDRRLSVNGVVEDLKPLSGKDLDRLQNLGVDLQEAHYDYFEEGAMGHPVRFMKDYTTRNFGPYKVPDQSYFMMGDNRDESSDSRVWGVVPFDHFVGKVSVIWLSCQDTLISAPMLCDPTKIRWSRILQKVQ